VGHGFLLETPEKKVLGGRFLTKIVRSVGADTFAPTRTLPSSVPSDLIDQLGHLAREERSLLLAVARAEGLTAEESLECVQDALCEMLADDVVAVGSEEILASAKTRVRNAARNFRRLHRRSKPHESVEDSKADVTMPLAEELVSRGEHLIRLRACVAELCSIQRAVVTLRLLDERSGEDVAEALGLSRGYVDVLVHRAKDALRICMGPG
jgi:RNA polymerase sigma-70 factor (ECF subfamily)